MEQAADVVAIGSGAGGLAACLAARRAGARVVLLEKADRVGGTAAISGGVVWAPGNSHMPRAERARDREQARAYFESLSADLDREVLAAFIDNAEEAIAILEQVSPLKLSVLAGYPDYYMDRPGARPEGGRALDADLFDFRRLGAWRDKVFGAGAVPRLMLRETPLGGATALPDAEVMRRRAADDLRGWGQAVVGALLRGCLDHGVEPVLGARATRLRVEDGRVVGVAYERGGETLEVAARHAVILATGGFEWNAELCAAFLRGPLSHPASPPMATGDGLKMAQRAGVGLRGMINAWWTPTLTPPGQTWPDGSPRSSPVLLERTAPGSIMVNRAGRRFCNEANNYSALAGAFHQFDPASYDHANLPAWLIFDATYKARYPVPASNPGLDDSWIVRRDTLAALAEAIGCAGPGLARTVETFNHQAAEGRDPEFHRGESPYDLFYGDRSRPGALGTLAPLSKAPYFAVPITIGALGTNGGVRTDRFGRALDPDGEIVERLYAVGNVMAAPTGSVYAGAGGTLGPALTFGVIAGRHAGAACNLTARKEVA